MSKYGLKPKGDYDQREQPVSYGDRAMAASKYGLKPKGDYDTFHFSKSTYPSPCPNMD